MELWLAFSARYSDFFQTMCGLSRFHLDFLRAAYINDRFNVFSSASVCLQYIHYISKHKSAQDIPFHSLVHLYPVRLQVLVNPRDNLLPPCSRNTPKMFLTKLVLEIRQIVYGFVFPADEYHIPTWECFAHYHKPTDVEFLCTSKQIYKEALKLVHSERIFGLCVNQQCYAKLDKLLQGPAAQNLQIIALDLDFTEYVQKEEYGMIITRLLAMTHVRRRLRLSIVQEPSKAHRKSSLWYVEDLKMLVGFEAFVVKFSRRTNCNRKGRRDPNTCRDPYVEHGVKVQMALEPVLGPAKKSREGLKYFGPLCLEFKPRKHQEKLEREKQASDG